MKDDKEDFSRDHMGKRGKEAEKKVKEALEEFANSNPNFDWERILDARSAGGRFPARPGDFGFFGLKLHGLIEVKEVKHAFRLPHGNFSTSQVAKLKKRKRAGGYTLIIVYHSPTKKYRAAPLSFFEERTGGSWDLSKLPEFDDIKAFIKNYIEEISNDENPGNQ